MVVPIVACVSNYSGTPFDMKSMKYVAYIIWPRSYLYNFELNCPILALSTEKERQKEGKVGEETTEREEI